MELRYGPTLLLDGDEWQAVQASFGPGWSDPVLEALQGNGDPVSSEQVRHLVDISLREGLDEGFVAAGSPPESELFAEAEDLIDRALSRLYEAHPETDYTVGVLALGPLRPGHPVTWRLMVRTHPEDDGLVWTSNLIAAASAWTQHLATLAGVSAEEAERIWEKPEEYLETAGPEGLPAASAAVALAQVISLHREALVNAFPDLDDASHDSAEQASDAA